eukprot:6213526-Pleurochrysis_carterae.AAC.2
MKTTEDPSRAVGAWLGRALLQQRVVGTEIKGGGRRATNAAKHNDERGEYLQTWRHGQGKLRVLQILMRGIGATFTMHDKIIELEVGAVKRGEMSVEKVTKFLASSGEISEGVGRGQRILEQGEGEIYIR